MVPILHSTPIITTPSDKIIELKERKNNNRINAERTTLANKNHFISSAILLTFRCVSMVSRLNKLPGYCFCQMFLPGFLYLLQQHFFFSNSLPFYQCSRPLTRPSFQDCKEDAGKKEGSKKYWTAVNLSLAKCFFWKMLVAFNFSVSGSFTRLTDEGIEITSVTPFTFFRLPDQAQHNH